MPLQLRVVRQDLARRKQEGGFPQRVRPSGEKHRRQRDAFRAERFLNWR